ncbi:hypothetical protein JOE09_003491 [Pantoea coffeiphila]|nr:hypothetical protein [Pantoea coffeiphila]
MRGGMGLLRVLLPGCVEIGEWGTSSAAVGRSSRRCAMPSVTAAGLADRRRAGVLPALHLSPASLLVSPAPLPAPQRCGLPGRRRGRAPFG